MQIPTPAAPPTPGAPEHPVYPALIATGGLEGCCAAGIAMDDSRRTLPADVFFIDCSGCLDAPGSLPTGNRRQPYARRGGAA